MDKEKNEMLKQVYKSAVRASYFGGIQNPQFTKKSKLQIANLGEGQGEIDEGTFRMMRRFKKPEQQFKVLGKKGIVFLDSGGFFCFGKKTPYVGQIFNTRLSIKDNNGNIVRYADFSAVSAEVLQKDHKIYIAFDGLPKNQGIQFQVQQKSQFKNWTNLLYKIIKQSQGAQKKYTYLARKCPKFYKYEHILNSQFQRRANTGDILLFRSPHSAARAQRMLTNSEYDHVGMVLRNKKNELLVFESSSQDGVGITPWKHMVKYQWYSQTQKICWRPLNITFSDFDIQTIQGFVAKTLGKQFQLNMNKLFQFSSKLQRTKQQQQKKTYFCSELVARVYKQLKLIDAEKSCSTYYPLDFSQKGNLRFIKNDVSLGNQKIIAFQKKIDS